MPSNDNKVELGDSAQEKENALVTNPSPEGTLSGSLRESVPPGVPAEDVVTPKTWFVVFTITACYGCAYAPFPGLAITQAEIAADIGAAGKATWITSTFFISGLVSFMICGPNSDLLGRRWFLIGGNVAVCVGYLISGTTNNFAQFVAGMAISGWGGAIGQMATFTAPELLPNKWRPAAVTLADSLVVLCTIIIPVIARHSLKNGTWPWLLRAPAIGAGIGAIVQFFYYYPPKHPRGLPLGRALREVDYVGSLLWAAAATLILVGITFASYLPSTDSRVLGTMVSGFAALIGFALWETWAPLKQPLTPTALFKANKGKTLTGPFIVASMVPIYYLGTNIIFGQIVGTIFSPGNPSSGLAMALSCIQGLGLATGGALLSAFGWSIKHWKWQLMGSVTLMTLFGGLLALASFERKSSMIAFNFLASTAFAWAQFLSITYCQFGAPQTQLGISGSLAGVGRFGGNAIATTVYVVVINNTLAKESLKRVLAAVIGAGGTQEMGVAALTAIPAGADALMAVPGITPAIAAAAGAAFTTSLLIAIRTVALVSIAFGSIGAIACLWCEDIGPKMDNHIEVFLENDVQASKNQFH